MVVFSNLQSKYNLADPAFKITPKNNTTTTAPPISSFLLQEDTKFNQQQIPTECISVYDWNGWSPAQKDLYDIVAEYPCLSVCLELGPCPTTTTPQPTPTLPTTTTTTTTTPQPTGVWCRLVGPQPYETGQCVSGTFNEWVIEDNNNQASNFYKGIDCLSLVCPPAEFVGAWCIKNSNDCEEGTYTDWQNNPNAGDIQWGKCCPGSTHCSGPSDEITCPMGAWCRLVGPTGNNPVGPYETGQCVSGTFNEWVIEDNNNQASNFNQNLNCSTLVCPPAEFVGAWCIKNSNDCEEGTYTDWQNNPNAGDIQWGKCCPGSTHCSDPSDEIICPMGAWCRLVGPPGNNGAYYSGECVTGTYGQWSIVHNNQEASNFFPDHNCLGDNSPNSLWCPPADFIGAWCVGDGYCQEGTWLDWYNNPNADNIQWGKCCPGSTHCSDPSDEINCSGAWCRLVGPPGNYTYYSGECITGKYNEWVADYVNGRASDFYRDLDCLGSPTSLICPPAEFVGAWCIKNSNDCEEGTYIDWQNNPNADNIQWGKCCPGSTHCSDPSDEIICVTTTTPPPTLRNTGCVSGGVVDSYGNTVGCYSEISNDTVKFPYDGPCDSTCTDRYTCDVGTAPDFNDGGCKLQGYYTDSDPSLPANSTDQLTCNTNCQLRYNYCCDYGVHDMGQDGVFSCDQQPQRLVGYYTGNAPTQPNPNCIERFRCDIISGCTNVGYWSNNFIFQGYSNTDTCTDCIERYECRAGTSPTDGGCTSIGYYFDTDAPPGSTDQSVCNTNCIKVWSCDPVNGPTFLRWDVASNIGPNEYDDAGIQACEQYFGCNSQTGTFDFIQYSTSAGGSVCSSAQINNNTCACKPVYSCDLSNGPTILRYQWWAPGSSFYLGDNEFDDTTIQDCTQRYQCVVGTAPSYSDGGCKEIGYYTDATAPQHTSTDPSCPGSGGGSYCQEMFACAGTWPNNMGGIVDEFGNGISVPSGEGCQSIGYYISWPNNAGDLQWCQTYCMKGYECKAGTAPDFSDGGCNLLGYYYYQYPNDIFSLTVCETNCQLRNTGCVANGVNNQGESDPEPCRSIYTTDQGKYPNTGACPGGLECTQIYTCDNTYGKTWNRWGAWTGVNGTEYWDPNLSCDQYYNCNQQQGCTDIGYFLSTGPYGRPQGSTRGTCATGGLTSKCEHLYSCEPIGCFDYGYLDVSPDETPYQASPFYVTNIGFCSDGGCNLRNTGCIQGGVSGIPTGCYQHYVDNVDQGLSDFPELGPCDPTCIQRSECNSTDPNASTGCQNLGYYTDPNAPSGSYNATECDGVCFKIYSCDPTNGPTFLRWGTSLGPDEYDENTIQDCILRNTGCVAAAVSDPNTGNTVGCYAVFSTSSIAMAPDGGNGPCNPDCIVRNTGCLPNGLSNLGKDDGGACGGALYTTDSTTYPVQGFCPTCVKVWSCDPVNGPTFLRWDVASNIASGELDDAGIANCILRNTGCVANGINNLGYGDIPCEAKYTVDDVNYQNLGTCPTEPNGNPACYNIRTCHQNNGPSWARYDSNPWNLSTREYNDYTDGCEQYYDCSSSTGCADLGFQVPASNGYSGTIPGYTGWNFTANKGVCSDGTCQLRNTGCINTQTGPGIIGCYSAYGFQNSVSWQSPWGTIWFDFPELGGCDPTCKERFECFTGTAPDFNDGGCRSLGYYNDANAPAGSMLYSACDPRFAPNGQPDCLLRYNYCFEYGVHDNTTNDGVFASDGGPQHLVGYYSGVNAPTQPDVNCVMRYDCNEQTGCSTGAGLQYQVNNTYPGRSLEENCDNCVAYYSCDSTSGKQFVGYYRSRPAGLYTESELGTCEVNQNGQLDCQGCRPIYACANDPNPGSPTFGSNVTLLRYSVDPPGANEYYTSYPPPSQMWSGSLNMDCIVRNTGCVNQGITDPLTGQIVSCYSKISMPDDVNLTYITGCDPTCQERFICTGTSPYEGGCTSLGYYTDWDPNLPVGSTTQNCSSTCQRIWSCTNAGPVFLRWSTDPPGQDEYDDAGIANCVATTTTTTTTPSPNISPQCYNIWTAQYNNQNWTTEQSSVCDYNLESLPLNQWITPAGDTSIFRYLSTYGDCSLGCSNIEFTPPTADFNTTSPPILESTCGIGALQNNQNDLWLPIRNVPVEVGCVFDNCNNISPDTPGVYHNYWAIDFLPPPELRPNGVNAVGQRINVYSAGTGTVLIEDPSPDSSCGLNKPNNIVSINHGNGVWTSYYHLHKILVNNGDQVDKNTVIGLMGTSGFTIPCPNTHLHFEKFINVQQDENGNIIPGSGQKVDPGSLWACFNGQQFKYPDIWGMSWNDAAQNINRPTAIMRAANGGFPYANSNLIVFSN